MILKELLETISNQTGAIVNVDAMHPRASQVPSLEITPRQTYHHGAYCQFRKLRGQQPACAANKQRSKAIARRGRTFWGTCPYGVWDLARPVFFNGRPIAVIYLGNFSDGTPLADVNGETFDGEPLEPITAPKQRELASYASFIAEFMRLACQQWVDNGNQWDIPRSVSFYKETCTKFIAARYTEPILLQDLAENMGLTPNHLGAIIKKQFGVPFRTLVARYRVEQAKVTLRSEPYKSITQIAYECGFSDSNYFSTVFKKIEKTTPRAYRQCQA